MDLASARLVPAAGGGGWLARLPGAVVFVPGDGEEAREMVSACLACAGAMELLGGVGSRLADPRAAPWPPFVLVAARGAEVVVVVHGPVEVAVERAGGQERLYGGDEVGSWLNKVVQQVQGLSAGRGVQADGLVDLREGVVRAGGFLLVPGAGPPADVERLTIYDAPGEGPPGWDAPGYDAPGYDAPGMADDATVVEQSATAAEGTGNGGVPGGKRRDVRPSGLVRGVCCPRMHLNDPRATTCRACGLAIAAGAPPVEGPRPPLGMLTWENGETDRLAGAVLVGRDVGLDAAVASGELAPLVPMGHNDSLSRIHAELRPSGWDVVVIDRASTNGTFVWDEPSRAWQRLSPGEAHVLQAGTVLAFGERTATFEPTDLTAP